MAAQRTRGLFTAAGLVSAALVLSRLLGYVREALLAARFGATHTTDAYLVAQDIPYALFAAIGAGLVMVFIPVYRTVVQQRGEDAGRRLANTTLNSVLIVAMLFVVLGWLGAPLIVRLLVPGLPDEPVALAVSLTRTMLPMVLFMAVSGVSAALLNANRYFTAPALVGFMSNVAVVSVLFLVAGPGQISWVAWAVVMGAALGLLVQLPWLPRVGFRYQPVLDWREPGLHQMLRLIAPVILTTYSVQFQNFVDRFLASHLAEGSISALNYAVRVNSLPYGVIGAALTTVLYPTLAEHVAAGRRGELRETVTSGLRLHSFILLPMAFGLLVFAEPIVQIVFQRGAFDPRATAATAFTLVFYAGGILFFGWLDFLNRCFFALQDTRTPMWSALGMVGINLAFSVALVGSLATGGLALGTSLSTVIAVAYLLWRLTGRLGGLEVRGLLRAVAANLSTAALGAAAGYLAYRGMALVAPGPSFLAQIIRLGAGLGIIVIVHVGLAFALGNQDVSAIRARLARRGRGPAGEGRPRHG